MSSVDVQLAFCCFCRRCPSAVRRGVPEVAKCPARSHLQQAKDIAQATISQSNGGLLSDNAVMRRNAVKFSVGFQHNLHVCSMLNNS
eukprot:4118060-Amphidinium_carterae.2